MDNNRKQMEAEIIAEAIANQEFRQALISNPKAALEAEYEITIPDSIKVSVLQESADQMYLVLPHTEAASGELSEDQLEAVVGGIRRFNYGFER